MLNLYGAQDAVSAEDVLACCDDGLCGVVVADGAFFLTFDVETESFLQEAAVLVVQGDDFMLV